MLAAGDIRVRAIFAVTMLVLATNAHATGDDSNHLAPPAQAAADTPVAACTDPPPERKGQIVTERRQSLPPVMALAALLETAPVQMMASPSAWWCSEKEFAEGAFVMQIRRSIRTADGVTSVQRIRVRDHAATLYVVFSALASAPLNKIRHAERLTWRAHVLFGPYQGGWAVYRVFDGEPAPEIVAPLIADLLAGKLSPLAYIDGAGVTHLIIPGR